MNLQGSGTWREVGANRLGSLLLPVFQKKLQVLGPGTHSVRSSLVGYWALAHSQRRVDAKWPGGLLFQEFFIRNFQGSVPWHEIGVKSARSGLGASFLEFLMNL